MVLAKVPITPQWNLTNGCVCTPDGGFLYVGSRSINYIGPIQQVDVADDENEPPVIKVFHTRQSILSIDVDPGWSISATAANKASENTTEVAKTATTNNQQKYFAALAQDNSVQIWDFDRGCAVSGHKAHFSTALYMDGNGPSPQGDHVLLSYMRNRNVLSVNAQDIVVYCVASNTYCRRPMFISSRNQTLTVLRCSPHNEHIFAVGTNRGLVVIGDLQSMSTLYMLRGHEAAITSLSWCPQNVPPFKQQKCTLNDENHIANTNAEKTLVEESQQIIEDAKQINAAEKRNSKTQNNAKKSIMPIGNDDMFDIYDYDYLENEFGAPTETEKKLKETDEKIVTEKSVECGTTTNFDFVEACQSLKGEIDALKQEQDYGDGDTKQLPDVTLADCQKVACAENLSSSCGDDSAESTEGSLDLAERSSDDEVCIDGGELHPKQQILHQVEVHAEQSNDLEKKEVEEKSDLVTTKPVTVVNIVENADKNTTKAVEVKIDDNRTATSESNSEQPSIDGVVSQDKTNTAEKRDQQPSLLASASVDGSFWIWNANTGASCDRLRAINAGKHGKNTSIQIDWLSSTEFLTTNKTGELSLWSMAQDTPITATNPQHQRYKFKADTKKLFLQRSVMSFSNSHAHSLLWCLSSHREISCENLQTEKLLLKYCCASTNVSAMRECPDDMNKIALALSDRRVGIIDISKMSATNVLIENFIPRIDASVLALVWSPDSKRLAFGTLEGRVGIIHVESGKPTITFNPFCGKPIYSIDWQGDHIFVVSNDILAVYDTNSEQKDAHIIREIKSISTVSVHDNVLYVGTQRGHVQVYHRKPNLAYSYTLVQDVPLAPRYITEISWSPIASDHVAVVANANNIHILKSHSPDGVLTPVRRIEIKNPKAANACVKWSNRNANEFLTCGFDGGVRVWDLNSTTNDEKFLKQFPCPMTCGLFYPTDEAIVMCAGKSTSVELFDMRLKESVVYSASKWKRSNLHTLDQVKWAVKVATRTEATKPLTAAEKRRLKRAENGQVVTEREECTNSAAGNGEAGADVTDLFNAMKLNEQNTTVAALEKTKVQPKTETKVAKNREDNMDWSYGSVYMRTPPTVLSWTSKELNKNVLDKLNMALSKPGPQGFLCPKLFGTKADAEKLLQIELSHIRSSKPTGIHNLFLMQLNSSTLKDEIMLCLQRKELSEWHVAVAPTISYKFWQNVCQSFAEQLLEKGYPLQAATYMMAMHCHARAIEMLLSKYYYTEALLIARVHLQDDDPLLVTIVDKWIAHLAMVGNLTASALISVLSGQFNRAHDILSRVRNIHPEIERVLVKLSRKQLEQNKQAQ